MVDVERYARDRWEVYGEHFAPFTVMAPDRQAAVERAIDRMSDVNNRRRARR